MSTRLAFGLLWATALILVACGDERQPHSPAPSGDTVGADTLTDTSLGDAIVPPSPLPDVPLTDTVEPDAGHRPDSTPTPPPDTTIDQNLLLREISPPQGGTSGGTPVMLTGDGFSSDLEVEIGGAPAQDIFVVDTSLLTCLTPPGGPGAADVVIRRPGDDAEARLAAAFVYSDALEIERLIPTEGPTDGGTPLRIEGRGFHPDTVVALGGRLGLEVTVESDRLITMRTPAGRPGRTDITLLTHRDNTTAPEIFRYYTPLDVTAVIPPTGATEGDEVVSIAGTGLSVPARSDQNEELQVLFGALPATVLEASSDHTLLDVKTPPAAPGPVTVTVRTSRQEKILKRGFTYRDAGFVAEPLSLRALSPARGSSEGGETVTLVVTGLSGEAPPEVDFGGQTATLLEVDAERAEVTVATPPHPAGLVEVGISVESERATLADAFEFVPPLEIESISPTGGPSTGGTPVRITGRGFSPDATVLIGPLAATQLQFEEGAIEGRTPPGSPGPADVRVVDGSSQARLPAAFTYETNAMALLAVEPSAGSQAGGTFVRLRGVGLPDAPEIWFDGRPATNIQRVSAFEVQARTPRGSGPGSVDVLLARAGGAGTTLKRGYTYFDPGQSRGGTWGGIINDSINVTVFESGTGRGLEGAFVILGDDPATPFKGLTDDRGQITFSTPGLRGPLKVNATKQGYTGYSVIEFDARNVSVWLSQMSPGQPGGGGGPGTPPPQGRVVGRVENADKYMLIPPGECDDLPLAPPPLCLACDDDDECGPGYRCTTVTSVARYCTKDCVTDSDCPDGFLCREQGALLPAQCIPRGGEPEIFCRQSDPGLFGGAPDPGIHAKVNQHNEFLLKTRFGETAIYCVAGARNPRTNKFLPLKMGIRRNILINSEVPITEVDIVLDIPLDRELKLLLTSLPRHPDGTRAPQVRGGLHLGSDGYLRLDGLGARVELSSDQRVARVAGQPRHLSGRLHNASYTLYATVTAQTTSGETPFSAYYRERLRPQDEHSLFERHPDGEWEGSAPGVPGEIYGLWSDGDRLLFAVGEHGRIYNHDAGRWSPQPAPGGSHLRDLSGAHSTIDGRPRLWAVGDSGRLVHFDGLLWTTWPRLHERPNLIAVSAASEGSVFTISNEGGVWRFDGDEWRILRDEDGRQLNDVWAVSANEAYLVGAGGEALRWTGQRFEELYVPTSVDLKAIHGRSHDEIIIVGAEGKTFHRSGNHWQAVGTPRDRHLRDVRLLPDGGAVTVGDGGAVFWWDGQSWIPEAEEVTAGRHLYRVRATRDGSVMAVGLRGLVVGPFMGYPMFREPSPSGGGFTGGRISWLGPGRVEPTYNLLTLRGPDGVSIWSTILDGQETDFVLPPLEILLGIPTLPPGPHRISVTRAYSPRFNIDNYQSRELGTFRRRTWSSSTIEAP